MDKSDLGRSGLLGRVQPGPQVPMAELYEKTRLSVM